MARDGVVDSKLKYITDLYTKEGELLQKIHNSPKENLQGIQLGAYEAKIVSMLLKMIGAKRVLEVGTLAGYSAAWMVNTLPEDGKLVTIEKSEENAALAKENLKDFGNKVEIKTGVASEVLELLSREAPFDAMFIDADKQSYSIYLDYAEKYVRPGGLIIADNTFLWGTVFEENPPEKNPEMWHGMKEFNERLADENKFDAIIMPTDEGLSVAIKK